MIRPKLPSRARIVPHDDSDLMRLNHPGLVSFLQSCGAKRDLDEGRRAHAFLQRSNREPRFLNLLVKMYGRCGRVEEARCVFAKIRVPNLYSWTMIVTAYAQNGHPHEALGLLRRMDLDGTPPDKIVLSIAVTACASICALSLGKQIHHRVASLGVIDDFLRSSLINLYGICGETSLAKSVFDSMAAGATNLVCWAAMIKAFARSGQFVAGIQLFWDWISRGIEPDAVTLVSAVDCCAGLGDLQQSQAIHARVLAAAGMESNEILASAVLSMFVRCKALDRARATFEAMEGKSVVPWTAMISAYAQIGRPREAFRLFQRMAMEAVRPNEVTFLGILEGFATRASFHHGRLIHACVDDHSAAMGLEFGPASRIKVSNAILDMYARCGSVGDARAVFDRMASRTNISWTSMVAAYAQNGHPGLALEVSREMDQAGMGKNTVTFITILSACNHGGLLEEGIGYLAGMRIDHGVVPSNAHYSCVVDLLGKAGRLEEAESIVDGLVARPDAGLWRSLLGSCRIHGDEERAGRAGEELKKLEPSDAAPYVVKKLFLLET